MKKRSFPIRKLTQREKLLLAGAVAFALTAALFWAPLSREVLTRLLLWSAAPAEQVIAELVAKSGNPASLLERLWRTDKIPHRLSAMRSLKRHLGDRPALYETLQPLLLAAARDADFEVRSGALEILAAQQHTNLARVALNQLRDADPAARVLGLQLLQRTRHPEWVPIIKPLLEDIDPRVIVSAALVLRAWTGQDFGIRLFYARPEFTGPRTPKHKDFDLERISQGVQRWQDWWNEHRNEYPKPNEGSSSESLARRFRAATFTLASLDGKKVRLTDYRGQTVLLSFWDPKTEECLDQFPALIELQRRQAKRLVVLGIALDRTEPECEHAHAHAHKDCHAANSKPDADQMGSALRDIVERQGINFSILIDPDGSVGRRYGSEELPTQVLIDADGRLRRRFVGARSAAALGAMIDEIAGLSKR